MIGHRDRQWWCIPVPLWATNLWVTLQGFCPFNSGLMINGLFLLVDGDFFKLVSSRAGSKMGSSSRQKEKVRGQNIYTHIITHKRTQILYVHSLAHPQTQTYTHAGYSHRQSSDAGMKYSLIIPWKLQLLLLLHTGCDPAIPLWRTQSVGEVHDRGKVNQLVKVKGCR